MVKVCETKMFKRSEASSKPIRLHADREYFDIDTNYAFDRDEVHAFVKEMIEWLEATKNVLQCKNCKSYEQKGSNAICSNAHISPFEMPTLPYKVACKFYQVK